MNIAIIGYGKMGKEIEKIAIEKGYNIVLKINSGNRAMLNSKSIKNTDVAIEFSNPDNAFQNINFFLKHRIPIVSGTTGWLNDLLKVKKLCLNNNGTFLYSSNFSIGVNLFFEINNYVSKLMSLKSYKISIEEKHHKLKKDSPSGTALKIKKDILRNFMREKNKNIPIKSKRMGKLKGEHLVKYYSEIDEIKISHKAYSRVGFAKGAILGAEFIKNKKGFFTMNDIIKNL